MNPSTIVSRTAALRHFLEHVVSYSLVAAADTASEVEIDAKDTEVAVKLAVKKYASIAKGLAERLGETGRPAWSNMEESVAKVSYLTDREVESICRWFFRSETK